MRRGGIGRWLMVQGLVVAALLLGTGAAQAKYASIVVEAESGRVLHAVNADVRNYPASLTKMMTLYLLFEAFENGSARMETPFTVSTRAAGMPPSKLGLRAGSRLTAREAMLALITKSANDAAVVIAEGLGSTEVKFARLMTDKARALGMRSTTFRNASGLPNTGQLSSARDMAVLGQRLIRDFPQYYGYFSTTEFAFNGVTHRNHNRLLGAYRGTDGIKTGYIRASGFNLVASVERDGHRLIGVVFGGQSSGSRDKHMMSLLDKGFSRVGTLLADRAPIRQLPDEMPEETLAQGDADLPDDGTTDAEDEVAVAAPTRPVLRAAPPPVAAAPTRPVRSAILATGDGEWAIQVGAFSREANARRAAEEAISLVGRNLSGAILDIDRLKGQSGTLFRSRLGGLSADAARESCKVLKARKRDCITIAPRG